MAACVATAIETAKKPKGVDAHAPPPPPVSGEQLLTEEQAAVKLKHEAIWVDFRNALQRPMLKLSGYLYHHFFDPVYFPHALYARLQAALRALACVADDFVADYRRTYGNLYGLRSDWYGLSPPAYSSDNPPPMQYSLAGVRNSLHRLTSTAALISDMLQEHPLSPRVNGESIPWRGWNFKQLDRHGPIPDVWPSPPQARAPLVDLDEAEPATPPPNPAAKRRRRHRFLFECEPGTRLEQAASAQRLLDRIDDW